MKTSDLVFIGIKGSVVALDRRTGEQVWATHLKGTDFVNLLPHDDVLLACCYGEVFCLNPLTGEGLWHNRLKGFGTGLATLAVERASSGRNAPVMMEKRRRDEAAAAAGAVAAV